MRGTPRRARSRPPRAGGRTSSTALPYTLPCAFCAFSRSIRTMAWWYWMPCVVSLRKHWRIALRLVGGRTDHLRQHRVAAQHEQLLAGLARLAGAAVRSGVPLAPAGTSRTCRPAPDAGGAVAGRAVGRDVPGVLALVVHARVAGLDDHALDGRRRLVPSERGDQPQRRARLDLDPRQIELRDLVPSAQLTANAAITACRSSSGMVSARGAAMLLTRSCDIVSPYAFRLLSLWPR